MKENSEKTIFTPLNAGEKTPHLNVNKNTTCRNAGEKKTLHLNVNKNTTCCNAGEKKRYI